jgi:hypothetical protein
MNVRLPIAVCAVATKWKEWLFLCGTNPECDTLSVLGNVLEELMDIKPDDYLEAELWEMNRDRIVQVLEENGLRYYRGGRVIPIGALPEPAYSISPSSTAQASSGARKPNCIDELLLVLLKNLRRAMHPLTHRRKGAVPLTFSSEYDVQDLLHALLRPWGRIYDRRSSPLAMPVRARGWTFFFPPTRSS